MGFIILLLAPQHRFNTSGARNVAVGTTTVLLVSEYNNTAVGPTAVFLLKHYRFYNVAVGPTAVLLVARY